MRPYDVEDYDAGRFDEALTEEDTLVRTGRLHAAAALLKNEAPDLTEIGDVLQELGVDAFLLRRGGEEVSFG